MRDMATDPTIAFALYYIETPLINASWSIDCEDSQLAAAVDAALRPIHADLITKFAQALAMGYQPLIKRWKLGKLSGVYRDKTSEEPEKDLAVWPSNNVDALLFKPPINLPPENCLPRWNEFGNFNGFMYSPVPIPNPMMLGVAQTYGPQILSGWPIPVESAVWVVNERQKNFGSLFGNPRSRRAYRFWWSRWYRWALADRSFETKADPAKLVYFPTDVTEALDVNTENETPHRLMERAIQAGRNVRSGSVVALPGDFMVGEDGKTLNQRKWEIKYLEGGENFSLLEQNFTQLNTAILAAMFLPEQAFVDATMAGQTSSQRYISAQMGEIYQESQQILSSEYDEYKNKYFIPEFIAANFPDKINIPCKAVTRAYGTQNTELVKQILTLIGQKNPENLPVDVRELLRQQGIPLNSEAQEKKLAEKRKESEENALPPVMSPTKKEGVSGYNAGVEKTQTGEHVYFQPGGQIYLAESVDQSGFLESLPKIPPYEDAVVRTASLKMKNMLVDRYRSQVKSLANQIRNKTILKLAQIEENPSKPGMSKGAAKIAAAGAVAAWVHDQHVSYIPAATKLKEILGRVMVAAGRRELKSANLDSSVFKPDRVQKWIDDYADEKLKLMDHTMQDEVKIFLDNQLQENSHPDTVAQMLEDHFVELPETHAVRAVRAQVRDAYNRGMLQAGIDAGIDQVMAHDASNGNNPDTDPKCVLRNGKVFNLSDAINETEHPNGCVVPETMILSSEGYIPIEVLGKVNGKIWQDIDITVVQESSLEKANKFFVNGDDEVYKLTTVRGHEFCATWKHKIRVVDDSGEYSWKRMCEVSNSDVVVMNLGGHESLLGNKDYLDNDYLGKLDEDFAEILGYYIGDGYLRRGKRSGGLSMAICDDDPDLIDWFSDWAISKGYKHVTIESRPGCKSVSINDIKIPILFDKLGYSKRNAATAEIPLAILKSRTSVAVAFIRGLFEADGQVDLQKSGTARISLSTISSKLATQVHSLIEALDIRATLSVIKDRKSSYGSNPLYRVTVASISDANIFCEKIGFISNRKHERLKTLLQILLEIAEGTVLSTKRC